MDFKKKHETFKKRFGMLDNYDAEKELNEFKTRILNIFDGIDSHINDRWIVKFCTYFGRRTKSLQARIAWGNNIHGALEEETDAKRLFLMIETIFALPINSVREQYKITYSKDILLHDVTEAIEISRINISITHHNEEVILYPRGEEELDKKLIEEVFSFLNPESQKHFVSAIKLYDQRNIGSYIRSAESIRRTIEEFLKFKLGNEKGLAENIKELLKRFKSDQISVKIRNIITQIFSYLDKYFNENCKHNDGDIDDNENEFLLYQAGLLMRYIHKEV